jgi:hypothetical protein
MCARPSARILQGHQASDEVGIAREAVKLGDEQYSAGFLA